MAGSKNAIPSLDGLRAISFLLVFVAHAGLDKYVPGGFGVTIFFFLSGYLITTLMRLEYAKHGSINLKHFWLRRALRILPPYYLILTISVLSTLILEPGLLAPHAVAAHYAFLANYWIIYQGYNFQPHGSAVFWSLAVEEHFYLLFPWLYVLLQHLKIDGRRQALFLWALCALVVIWRMVLVYYFHTLTGDVVAGAVPLDRTYMGTDTRIDSILFGCALAVWRNPAVDGVAFKESVLKYLVLPVSLVILFGCLVIRNDAFRETWRYTFQGIGLTGLFVAAIAYPNWGVFKLLNWRPVMFIGALSYSLYLVHDLLIFALARYASNIQELPRAVLALALAIAISYVVYLAIEQPCARLRRRLAD